MSSNMYCKRCRKVFDMSGAILCRCPQCGDKYMTAAEGFLDLSRVYAEDPDDLCATCQHNKVAVHSDPFEKPTPECRAHRWHYDDRENVSIQTPTGSLDLWFCEKHEREV